MKILAADKDKIEKVKFWIDMQMDKWMKKISFDEELNKVKLLKDKQKEIIEKEIKKFN